MKKLDYSFIVPMITGVLLLILASYSGLKMTSDSHLYLKGAEYIKLFGFTKLWSQEVFLAKPLLYPLFLRSIGGNIVVLRILHVCIYILSFAVFNQLGKRLLERIEFRWLMNFMFVFSAALIMDHVFVWTEPLFILLLLIDAFLLFKYYSSKSCSQLLFITFIGILLVGLRHVGIVFALSVGVSTFLFSDDKIDFNKINLLKILSFFLPLLFFSWWQWQVYFIGDYGDRLDHFGGLNFFENLLILSDGFSLWFMPAIFPRIIQFVISIAIIVSLFFLSRTYLLKTKDSSFYQAISLICLLYLGLLITKGDMIFSDNERYLSILYPFLLMVTYKIGEQVINQHVKIKPHFMLMSGAILLYHTIRVVKNVVFWSEII